ncbi:MAG: response regulator [Ardenticatenales bacterium]|nr:response regulator [Ardenticatenales bacterium]
MRLLSDFLTVLILEDGTALRRRLVDLIRSIAGVNEVLEAGDAPTALALARRHRPQIVVLDIRVPGDAEVRNGLDVLGAIKRGEPDTYAIILTNFADAHYARLARQLGADAFLDKSSEFDMLVSLIEDRSARNEGPSPSVA